MNKPFLIDAISNSNIGKRKPPDEAVKFEPLDEEYNPVSETFNERDRKKLLQYAKKFDPEAYEKVLLDSSRILVAAIYSDKVTHTTKTKKGFTSVRHIGQVVAISLDELATGELHWALVSPLAVTGQRDSDRAWQPLHAVIETFANLVTVDGRQVYYIPHYDPGNADMFHVQTRDLCYIAEWAPSVEWFESHGDRPALSRFEAVYKAAKQFVYEPLGEDI